MTKKSNLSPSATPEPTVFVVDDNEAFTRNLRWLCETVHLPVETFSTAQGFLERYTPCRPGCLLLDVRLPGMGGLDLQQRLREQGMYLPIIFVTGHGDIPMVMRAVKGGAFDFIEKPFNHQVLLDRIHQALQHDATQRSREAQRLQLHALFARLSLREREVLDQVVDGKSNKTIANTLNLSAKTVEVHRAKMMEKLQAHSVVDVVRLSMQMQLLSSRGVQSWSHG